MFNSQKRRTLKLLGSAGLSVGSLIGSGTAAASFSALNNGEQAASGGPGLSANGRTELGIKIINSRDVVENTVLLTNNNQSTIFVERFLPAHIIYNNKLLDLNAALPKSGLRIDAGQVVARDVDIWQLLSQPVIEYVWAEHAVEAIGNGTELVSLGAFFADNNAIVFADPAPAIAA